MDTKIQKVGSMIQDWGPRRRGWQQQLANMGRDEEVNKEKTKIDAIALAQASRLWPNGLFRSRQAVSGSLHCLFHSASSGGVEGGLVELAAVRSRATGSRILTLTGPLPLLVPPCVRGRLRFERWARDAAARYKRRGYARTTC
jgi:hypothetical protein